MREMEHLSCGTWLKELGLSSLEKRRLRGSFVVCDFPVSEGNLKEKWDKTTFKTMLSQDTGEQVQTQRKQVYIRY